MDDSSLWETRPEAPGDMDGFEGRILAETQRRIKTVTPRTAHASPRGGDKCKDAPQIAHKKDGGLGEWQLSLVSFQQV
jgi:hypothetical protein